MWLLVITTTIENSSVYLNHLSATVFLVYFNEGRREISTQLPAGTQRKAVVVQQAYVNKKKKKARDRRNQHLQEFTNVSQLEASQS